MDAAEDDQQRLQAAIDDYQAGRFTEAWDRCAPLLTDQNRSADAFRIAGTIALGAGRNQTALSMLRSAIDRDPENAYCHCLMAAALEALGQGPAALTAHRVAAALTPQHPLVLNDLGLIWLRRGNSVMAAACFRHAVAARPDFAEAGYNLGKTLHDAGQTDPAMARYQWVLALRPDDSLALNNFAACLLGRGQNARAVAGFRHACAVAPAQALFHNNLGVNTPLRQPIILAIALDPGYAEFYTNLGAVEEAAGHLSLAVSSAARAVTLDRGHAVAWNNLGNALRDQGLLANAMGCFERAVTLAPGNHAIHSNVLFSLNYDDRLSPPALFARHRDWGARWTAPEAPTIPVKSGRLRIGYLSPDLWTHAVAFFFEPLLRHHDRSAFAVHVYADGERADQTTARLQSATEFWRSTAGMTDMALAQQIQADGIDILVDLAGHTAKNRLPLFARRAAPRQVTWLGYPHSTGLSAMDVRFVDAITDPPGAADALASEKLLRLPGGFLCYAPPSDAPLPGPPPCLAGQPVTFGSFNNPAKLSEATLDLWALLLRRSPEARLLLKGRTFDDEETAALFRARLEGRGIAPDRLLFIGLARDRREQLQTYAKIDIALDPMPYNGTTTTCESLWMGVPVVTLRGDRHAARVGASLLAQAGLSELIAEDAPSYLDIATGLAADRPHLAALRQGLRPRLAQSPLCDAPTFAGKIEAAYRAIAGAEIVC